MPTIGSVVDWREVRSDNALNILQHSPRDNQLSVAAPRVVPGGRPGLRVPTQGRRVPAVVETCKSHEHSIVANGSRPQATGRRTTARDSAGLWAAWPPG